MDEALIMRRLLLMGVIFGLGLIAWWPEFRVFRQHPSVCDDKLLCVVFLDVGQGDAIFIQSPTGTQMLIDSGRPDGAVLRELGSVMDFSDRSLDYVLLTHFDADHIGGFEEVFARYDIANVIKTENESDTDIARTVVSSIEREGSQVSLARRGQRYDLGAGIYLEILFPDTNPSKLETNTASIVAKLVYDDSSFMLTGDSPKAIEEYLVLLEGENLESDVLKAGHHGSRTSTSELFLDEVDPQYAVISAGKDNSYGHPHLEVTDLLFNKGVTALNTADEGQIVFWSDGKEINLK